MRLQSLIALSFTLCLLGGASEVSQAQPSRFKKFWHNTNAHYNGYFNAKMKLDEAAALLAKNQVDDFSKVLMLTKFGEEKAARGAGAQFDEVIKKASNVIQLHGISKWTDDSYLVVGEGYFYKRDYFESIETFQYVYTRYKNKPVSYEALAYLIRAYTATKQYGAAQGAIDQANTMVIPVDHRPNIYRAQAEFYLNQQEYDKAAVQVAKLVAITDKKAEKARAYFILGQLNALAGDKNKAILNFRQVLKLKPVYEMEFAAKLAQARLYDQGTATGASIKRELRALVKDDKNAQYRDVLYYELGNIAIRDNNAAEAKDNWLLSTTFANKNTAQKGLSFLALADQYVRETKYRPAAVYYDSAATFLDKAHPEFASVQAKAQYFDELVDALETIRGEDSLQQLAGLPENERMKAVDRQINLDKKAAQRAEEERATAELIAQQNAAAGASTIDKAAQQNQQGPAVWYFYNTTSVSAGAADFIRRWGARPLEDNWRRSKKETPAFTEGQPGGQGQQGQQGQQGGQSGGGSRALSPEEALRAAYVKNIPASPEAKLKSDVKIEKAHIQAASVYKEKLKNPQEAILLLVKLLQRFPATESKALAYYQLWQGYTILNNLEKAEEYKQLLISNFPASQYAQLAQGLGPKGKDGKSGKDDEAKAYYEETYRLLQGGDAASALTRASQSDSLFKGNPYRAKFALVKAMAQGRLEGREALIAGLDVVAKGFAGTPERAAAQEMLASLNAKADSNANSTDAPSAKPKVDYDLDNASKKHYYVAVFETSVKDINTIKNRLADFNTRSFSGQNLQVQQLMYDGQKQMLIIKELKNQNIAMEYFRLMEAELPMYKGVPSGSMRQFVVTIDNFGKLFQAKDTEGYMTMFQQAYLTKK